jgi:hypothetical protein
MSLLETEKRPRLFEPKIHGKGSDRSHRAHKQHRESVIEETEKQIGLRLEEIEQLQGVLMRLKENK